MMGLRLAAKFKKDYKRVKRQGKDISKLGAILEALVRGEALPRLRATTRWTGRTVSTASATSSRTGCSSTVSTRGDLFSSIRAPGTAASCRDCDGQFDSECRSLSQTPIEN